MKYSVFKLMIWICAAVVCSGGSVSIAIAGEPYIAASQQLVVVGTISDIELNVISMCYQNGQRRTEYFDIGWIEVEEVLKGRWIVGERIKVMIRGEIPADSLWPGSPSEDPVTVSNKQRAIWALAEAAPPIGGSYYISGDMCVNPFNEKVEVLRWCFDTPPKPIGEVDVVYPEFLREWGIEGIVFVQVLIGADGTVVDAEAKNSYDRMLNEYAIATAKKFRFEPAVRYGEAVECYHRIPVVFKLED